MIDTHCHLDALRAARGRELVERARAAGVARLATVGTNGPSIDRALAAARGARRGVAIVGRHPHETEGFDDAGLAEIEQAAADPRARAIGETGLDYFRDYAPRDDQRRAFEAQLELAARLGPAGRHPHARGRGRHVRDAARARRLAAGGDPALLLGAGAARRVRRARLPVLVRGQRHLPEGDRPPGRGRATRARRAAAGRDGRALPVAPAACAASRTSPPTWCTPPASWPSCAASPTRSSSAPSSANAARVLRLVSGSSRARPASGACASSGCARTASSARTS